jgi:phosphate transport system permease protein
VLTVLISFPLGVGAALYLEEYAADNAFNRMIETNIRNLAGVPSIIYGMLGLTIFVRTLEGLTGGRSVLAGALTMSLLILPIIIINAREALRAVPSTIREASYGLGATQWQTISRQVFPSALPGMLTGTILGLSRAIGETAPLFGIATTFINTDPTSPLARFTVLPMQIYTWTGQPSELFRFNASAAIIVLLVLLLGMNSIAIILRNRAVSQRY